VSSGAVRRGGGCCGGESADEKAMARRNAAIEKQIADEVRARAARSLLLF
jgi:hypothetical protein